MTLNEQLHLVTGVLAGFLMARPLIPSAYAIDDHRLASLMADWICRSMSVSVEAPLAGTDVARLLAGGDRTRSSMQAAPH